MASIFEESAADASAAVDEVFGETLHIVPMAQSQYAGGTPDPSRAAFDIVGAFFSASDRIKMQSTKVGRDFFQQFVGAKCFISIDIGAMAGLVINKGDRVMRYDDAGDLTTPAYEVSVGGEREVSRMIYPLVEASDPS